MIKGTQMKTIPEKLPNKQNDETNRKIECIFKLQKTNKWRVGKQSAQVRIEKLKGLVHWIHKNRNKIHSALYKDLKKPSPEVDLQEIYVTLIELNYAIRNLKKWIKHRKVKRTKQLITSRSWIYYEPKGQVLIITPWNFPFMLTITAVGSAIAAGNCIIIKPSELASHTSCLIKEMISDLFPESEIAVIEGNKEVGQALLKKPFDHIFFTGSSTVGKKVMRAAAENLTTITLELGGKSPVIVDETAKITDAAQKIIWGKFLNASQTCIAPDYIFINEKIFNNFLNALKEQLKNAYGNTEDARYMCKDFTSIIDRRHYKRIKILVEEAVQKGAKMEVVGNYNDQQRYIAPILLSNVPLNTALMNEEIFGPVLPLIKYRDVNEALMLINQKEKPLALYIFSKNKNNIDTILSNTRAGGTCINDVVVQFFHSGVPFGGVNYSGHGNTHGFYGFKAFSHERSIVSSNQYSLLKLVYPPFTKEKKKLINFLIHYWV